MPSQLAAEGRILEVLADGMVLTGTIEEVATQFALEAHELATCLSALGAARWVRVSQQADGCLQVCLEQ